MMCAQREEKEQGDAEEEEKAGFRGKRTKDRTDWNSDSV